MWAANHKASTCTFKYFVIVWSLHEGTGWSKMANALLQQKLFTEFIYLLIIYMIYPNFVINDVFWSYEWFF